MDATMLWSAVAVLAIAAWLFDRERGRRAASRDAQIAEVLVSFAALKADVAKLDVVATRADATAAKLALSAGLGRNR